MRNRWLIALSAVGIHISIGSVYAWSVLTRPIMEAMGCYFLTLSLMSSVGAPLGLMGVILPIYTIIDMIETAENVWSDSTVCAMTNHDLEGKLGDAA